MLKRRLATQGMEQRGRQRGAHVVVAPERVAHGSGRDDARGGKQHGGGAEQPRESPYDLRGIRVRVRRANPAQRLDDAEA